jgi:hypothetical protein
VMVVALIYVQGALYSIALVASGAVESDSPTRLSCTPTTMNSHRREAQFAVDIDNS